MKRNRKAGGGGNSGAAPGAIEGLRNLGPRTQQQLRAVGIETVAALRRIGPVEAYLRLKAREPRRVTLVMLYALYGALTGTHWNALPEEVKARLKAEVQEAGAESGLAPPPARSPARRPRTRRR